MAMSKFEDRNYFNTFAEGKKEGLSEGIKGAVDLLRQAGVDDAAIISGIMQQFNLPKDEAEDYVGK